MDKDKSDTIHGSDEEKDAELFNQIIQLPLEVRNRLMESVKIYDLVMSEGSQNFPQKG